MVQNVFIHQIPTKSYKTTRQHFCTSFIRKCEQNSDFVKELRYSDETHFFVDDKINSKKIGYWLHGKPDVVARSTTLLSQDHTHNDHWAAEMPSGHTSWKTSAATRRPSTLSGTGGCWRNFGEPSRQSRRMICKSSSTRDSNRTVSSPYRPRNPGLATGAPRGARDVNVWDVPLTVQLPRFDPIGILSVGSLQVSRIPDQLVEPLRPRGGGEISGRLCTPPCAAIMRRPRCAELNCASSETGVTANMPSARPVKVPLGIGSSFKENIIEQAFTWYPIRGSIANTTGKMQVLNLSDFF